MMNNNSPPNGGTDIARAIVDFAGSDLFMRTFEEGMGMVEETASYLDGKGRAESRALSREVALAYAGESMRLTTRLMQIASWLLVQRSVFDEEMLPEDAASDKYRLGSKDICRGNAVDGSDQLPAKLLDLLDRSRRLYDRVDRLDQQLYMRDGVKPAVAAQLGDQMKRLETAFNLQAVEE